MARNSFLYQHFEHYHTTSTPGIKWGLHIYAKGLGRKKDSRREKDCFTLHFNQVERDWSWYVWNSGCKFTHIHTHTLMLKYLTCYNSRGSGWWWWGLAMEQAHGMYQRNRKEDRVITGSIRETLEWKWCFGVAAVPPRFSSQMICDNVCK